MGFLKNTWLTAAWWGLSYAWLEAMRYTTESSGYTEIAWNIASEVWNILQQWAAYIGDTAPIALEQFIQNFWADEVLFGWIGVGVAGVWWYLTSNLLWKIVWAESKSDDTIASLWWAAFAWLSVLWLAPAGLVVWAWAWTYVIGRKLGEKILWEKYAKLVWWMSALASSSATLWIASTVLPWLLVAWWAGLVWKKWVTPFHNWKTERNDKKKEKIKERNQKIAARRRERIEARENAKNARSEKRRAERELQQDSQSSTIENRRGPRSRPKTFKWYFT